MKPLLTINNLSVNFGQTEAVKNITFQINNGETLALVGESGSGKSVSALSILQLLPYPSASHPSGEIIFQDKSLLNADLSVLEKIRGNKISMIFQEPMLSLNPLHCIEKQISEILILHQGLPAQQAKEKTLFLLQQVGIKNPASRLTAYPHELSGGQRQRVMIAMALANEPALLIADEPTTALDVTVQLQILTLLRDLQNKSGMAMLLITHDLGIVSKMADRVAVMHQGEIIEQGETKTVFNQPQHNYTQALINSEINLPNKRSQKNAHEILRCDNLSVGFPIKKGVLQRTKGYIKAVEKVKFKLYQGQTLGIVGESGSGKSTLALAILRLVASQGNIVYCGQEISDYSEKQMRPLRRNMQIVFQDPFASLSPRLSIAQIISEGLHVHFSHLSPSEKTAKVCEVLEKTGIDPDTRHRYPHEFSGGQRQRFAIARALVIKPKMIVFDEPTSALDRTIQLQILTLLQNLQQTEALTYLFISHDLSIVKAISDYVLVMYEGEIIEQGLSQALFSHPQQAYTQQLLEAAQWSHL